MPNYFLVKNLFDYEEVIPPPSNLPKELNSVYLTDSDINVSRAIDMGWQIVKKTEKFLNIEDKFERRKSIGYINSFPLKIIPEMSDVEFIFICDSNIVRLWDSYLTFIKSCDEKTALFVTSGYYQGQRDNIIKECEVSCSVERWNYNHLQIKNCTERYLKELTEKKIDVHSLSVVSAKYFGWNTKHPDYETLSNILYQEYSENLQGNIILTYISGIHKDKVFNFYNNDYSGSILNTHKYSA